MISLKRRFTFWSLGAAALLAIVTGVSLYLYVRTTLYGELDAGLRTRAQVVGSLLRIEDDGNYGMDFSDESMPEYLPGNRPEYFQVIAPGGHTLERSESLKGGNLLPASVSPAVDEPWNMVLPDGREGRAIAISAMAHADADDHDQPAPQKAQDKGGLPPALVIVAQDRLAIDRALDSLLSALTLAGLVLAVGCIVAVRYVVWQALSPVNDLARRAQEVGPANLDYRFDIAALPEELQLICQRLNALLERLDQAFARERRFNADIAHELRTPIAELRTLTEVARRWPTDATQLVAYFNDAHAIALKMGSLVDSLLILARTQGRIRAEQKEVVSLTTIIEQSLSLLREKIDRRRLEVLCQLPSACSIISSRLIFTQMIENILSNAVDYATEGGRIECKAEMRADECFLTIGNSDNSLSAEDVKQMLDPFWRKDAARTDSDHAGLGLALVAEYAKQLGILIEVRLRTPSWFEIMLKIPGKSVEKETTRVLLNQQEEPIASQSGQAI